MHKGKIYRHERSQGPTVPFTNLLRTSAAHGCEVAEHPSAAAVVGIENLMRYRSRGRGPGGRSIIDSGPLRDR
jgi:hypothetical protein